jgi:hypothetical protein
MKKMETIEIGFVHTYPCFLSGDIRSYSQPFTASLPFKRLAMRVLGPRAETLYMPVYKLIALLTILPLAYLLYKNPGPFLYIQYFTNWIEKSFSFIPISKYFSVKCLKS